MTRPVDQSKAKNYLRKAEDSIYLAKIAFKEGKDDAAAMNAVHSAINALDALTTFYLGKRASGDHTAVLPLTRETLAQVNIRTSKSSSRR